MNVLFLVPKLETPSTRWRVAQLVPHFEKAGIRCTVQELPAGMIGKLAAARHAAEYDVVFLQKKLLPKLINARLRKYARKLVFEFDDVVTLRKTGEGVRSSTTRERRFRRVLQTADAVVAANEYYAEQALRMGAAPERVQVLPSAIDLARWPVRADARGGDRPIVGWSGSTGNLQYLELVRQPLVRLWRRHEGLVLRIVCEESISMPGLHVEHRKFSLKSEVEDLQSFDIAIAPQVEDAWTRGRVNTKVLAYFAAGVPTVASNVASHRLYIREGENGYLAGTLLEWEEKMDRLLRDAELRRRIGAAGRATARDRFSIEAVVPKYLELFRRLTGK